jgi:hypothetical protein
VSRPHGYARVNARSPRAAGICDRCGFLYQHADLRFQFDYRGPSIQNLRLMVCRRCEDKPQPQLGGKLSQDPVPIRNARPEPFAIAGVSYDGINYFTDENGMTEIIAEDGTAIIQEGDNSGG